MDAMVPSSQKGMSMTCMMAAKPLVHIVLQVILFCCAAYLFLS